MAGAQPTLTGITDDASRGGLFDRSNVANPVSGADVQGTVINDSEITLSITINGDTQTQSFFTNQAAASTESFDFTVAGGTSTGGSGFEVTSGSFDVSTQTLTLNRSGGAQPVTITGFAFSTITEAEVNTLADARIGAANIQDLNNVPAIGTSGQVLSVAADGMNLQYVDPATAAVSSSSFASPDMSIDIQQNGNIVDLEAQPTWTGNTNLAPTGTTAVTSGVQVQNLTIGADTGLVLVDTGSGTYTLRAQRTLTTAVRPTVTSPEPRSALLPAPEQVITFRPQGTDMVTAIDNVGVTTPMGVTVTPTTDTTGGVGTITIPAGETNAPFEYEVTSDVTTTSADGETTQTPETQTINRFVPFWQSRSEPMDESDILSGAISQDDWEASGNQFVAGPGSGLIYLSVLASSVPSNVMFADQATFPVRVSLVRSVAVRLADGTQPMFNVFRMPGGNGQTISNFRTTR